MFFRLREEGGAAGEEEEEEEDDDTVEGEGERGEVVLESVEGTRLR